MPTARTGSVDIAYEDSGGDAPAILFCHAFGMTGAMFAPQVEAFRRTHRCITWDSRGHGGTRADGPFDFWTSARDALDLLDHLGVEKASFVGTSQGGFLALRAALLAPGRVASLTVLGSSAHAEEAGQRANYTMMHDIYMASPEGDPPEAILDGMATICLGDYAGAAPWKALWRSRPKDQFNYALQALVGRDAVVERLAEIRAPTLVLHGSADHAYAPALGQAIADGVAGDRDFVLIEGGAHFLSLTHPDPVNAHLAAFLAKV